MNNAIIADLRSDTVTKPGKAMREAMLAAPVGDDVMGEDPTVNCLQDLAASRFGMEAALFCPSGTMTNQVAIATHCRPGDEVICDQLAHIYLYEGGGIARHAGASVRLLPGDHGRFTPAMVEAAINPDDVHRPVSRLVAVENTVNKGGGAIWDLAQLQAISRLCRQKGLAFHMDGARLFNALAVTGEPASAYGALFDSISICLSKGLGAPVGSLLLGNAGFIKQARRVRKVMGGGMRQAGFLAAAGIHALENNLERLADDHRRAKHLGTELARLPWVAAVLPVPTNIVIFRLGDGLGEDTVLARLKAARVLAVGFGPGLVRFVTHLDFGDRELQHTIEVLRALDFSDRG